MTENKTCLPCDGIQVLTPRSIINRPGLEELKYRIGSQGTFFESLLARISTLTRDELTDLSLSVNQRIRRQRLSPPKPASEQEHPLRDWLTTRDKTDPTIALLDAWSTVADVLTFYQERLANEGFLRTAKDRQSIRELARLIGYRLRPGVASTVYLAFEVDDSATQNSFGNNAPTTSPNSPVIIPAGTSAKSTPTPGTTEEPQTFETSKELLALTELNELRPRLTQPQRITPETVRKLTRLYFKGVGLRLKINDYIAVVCDQQSVPVLHQIVAIKESTESQQTAVYFPSHPLSEVDLIEEVLRLIEQFPSAAATMPTNDLLPNLLPTAGVEFRERVRSKFNEILQDAAKPPQKKISLKEIDTGVSKIICDEILKDNSPIRTVTAAQLKNAQDLQKKVKTALDTISTSVVQPYKLAMTNLLDRLKKEDDAIASLIDGPASTGDAASIVAVKTAIRVVADAQNVGRIICATSIKDQRNAGDPITTSVAPQLPAPEMNQLAASILLTGAPADLTLQLEATVNGYTLDEPTGKRNEWNLKRSNDASASDVNSALAMLKIKKISKQGRRYCLIRIPTNVPNQADAFTLFAFDDGENTDYRFDYLEASTFCKIDKKINPIKTTFAFQGPNALYAARIRVVGNFDSGTPNDTLDFPGTSLFRLVRSEDGELILALVNPSTAVTAHDVATALKAVTFQPGGSNQTTCRSLLIEIFKTQDVDDPPIILALREICVYSSSSAANAGTTDFVATSSLPTALLSLQEELTTVGKTLPDRESLVKGFATEFGASDYWNASDPSSKRSILYLTSETNTRSVIDGRTGETADDFVFLATLAAKDITDVLQPEAGWQKRVKELALRRKKEESLASEAINTTWISEVRGALVAVDGADQQFEAFINRVSRSVPDIKDVCLVKAASIVKTVFQTISSGVAALLGRFQWLDDNARDLGNDLTDSLNRRRRDLLDLLVAAIDDNDDEFPLPTPASLSRKAAKVIRDVRGRLASLRENVTRQLSNATHDRAEGTCKNLANGNESSCSAIRCVVDSVRNELVIRGTPEAPISLTDALGGLKSGTDVSKTLIRSLESMIRELETLALQVDPVQTGDEPGSQDDLQRSVEHILGEIARVGTVGAGPVMLRDITRLFAEHSDLVLSIAKSLDPTQRSFLYDLLRQVRIDDPALKPQAFVFRSKANVFGWNASGFLTGDKVLEQFSNDLGLTQAQRENAITNIAGLAVRSELPHLQSTPEADKERRSRIFLDGEYAATIPGTFLLISRPPRTEPNALSTSGGAKRGVPAVYVVTGAITRPRSAYDLKNTATVLDLDSGWWNPSTDKAPDSQLPEEGFEVIQSTRVYCDAEELALDEEPIESGLDQVIDLELNSFVDGLATNNPVAIQGSPQLVSTNTGVIQTEIAHITDITHGIHDDLFADSFRTTIRLSLPLQFNYVRASVKIYANVVEATHGETQREVLGSGDGAREFQKFLLKRPDVTRVLAPNERGIKNTLVVKINDVEWTEQESLRDARADDEQFLTLTDDDQRMTVQFGDGVNAARLPTGVENIRAEYRTGLGQRGNVASGQINQLLGAPLGVKKVINPLAARGGADPESRDLAQLHAPLAVTAMDRLVSVQDYEDFARTYAGIGKASASLLQGLVLVTIAGLDPDPLEQDNPLFSNLMQAFGIFGDPSQQFSLRNREASLLILSAKVKIKPRYEWDKVQPKIRAALLERFHYDRQELGMDLLLSDAIAAIQSIDGVLFVDVDKFDAVRQDEISNLAARLQANSLKRRPRVPVELARFTSDADELAYPPPTEENASLPRLRAAQVCYLTPDIPDTLILEQIR